MDGASRSPTVIAFEGRAIEATTLEGPGSVRAARQLAAERAAEFGYSELGDSAGRVAGELVTNAILHGGGCAGIDIHKVAGGVRISVSDGSRTLPLLGRASDQAMTGRGMAIVGHLASNWGVTQHGTGKIVWADVTSAEPEAPLSGEDLIELWAEDFDGVPKFLVELGEVPTEFLLAAKAHVDNLVREFTLLAVGAAEGATPPVPSHLAGLLEIITERFADARLSIKEQALRAAHANELRTNLCLELTSDAAEAGEEYLLALGELDEYCRAARLFTLETEPEHRVFRNWYVGQIVEQLRAARAGQPPPEPVLFEERLLDELRNVTAAQRGGERTERLSRLARVLVVSATPESVADAVLNEGVAALRADAGGMLLSRPDKSTLALPGAVGYAESVINRMRDESRNAELPAAVALRTGEPVWLETKEERDERFPELVGFEPDTEALCAVPLAVGDRLLGALRFSFRRPHLFDAEEQQFVLALADQTAQALDRAQLQYDRIDISRRLQRSLLPPDLPSIPGLELAAIYHPFGDGVDVGGDFYDAWHLGEDQWAIALGDAAGTGPEAAAMTALVRHSLRALSLQERRAREVMRRLNTLLTSAGYDDERFCTAIFGIVTLGEHVEVELAGGGHPHPRIRRPDGSVGGIDLPGAMLGVYPDIEIGRRHVMLRPGTALVLYTDGAVEARAPGGAFFGEERLDDVIARSDGGADEIAANIERSVLAHTSGTLQDDMAIVVLRAEDEL